MDFRQLINQFKKFAVVGFSSTAINYGVFFVLFEFFHVYYALAHVIGYVLGVLFGYAFNRSWTFESVIPKKRYEFILYVSVYIFSLIVSVSVLQILVEQGRLNPLFANVLAIGVSMVINFVGCKFLVFNEKRVG